MPTYGVNTFILPENEFHDSRDEEREKGREERVQGSELRHAGEAHLTSNISNPLLPHAGETLLSNPPSTIPDPPKRRSTPPLPHHRSTNTQDPPLQSPAKTHPSRILFSSSPPKTHHSRSPIASHASTSTG